MKNFYDYCAYDVCDAELDNRLKFTNRRKPNTKKNKKGGHGSRDERRFSRLASEAEKARLMAGCSQD